MNERLLNAFEDCLNDLDRGLSIDECLNKYPFLSKELRPALEGAIAARSVSSAGVPAELMNSSRTKLLSHAARLRSEKSPIMSFIKFPVRAVTVVFLVVLFLFASRQLVVVSAKSLPGDSLYLIKRTVQNIRVKLIPNQEVQHDIETQYREQRVDEVRKLMDLGLIRQVSFEGVVTQMAPAKWLVNGIPVMLTEETLIVGDIHPGFTIEVEGNTTKEGWIQADELHLREFTFIGQAASIDKDYWLISGIEFQITSLTQIDTAIQVGDNTLVLARSHDNGILSALAILHLPDQLKNIYTQERDISTLTSGKITGDIFEFTGPVEMISATAWVIEGYSVSINLQTVVDDEISLGETVKVKVIVNDDGSLLAVEIGMESDAFDEIEEDEISVDDGELSEQEEGDTNESSSTEVDDESDNPNDDSDATDNQSDDTEDDSDSAAPQTTEESEDYQPPETPEVGDD